MSVQSGLSPTTHSDGRRTAANLVDCLIGDIQAVMGTLAISKDELRDIENRFHITIRHHRRLVERRSKKLKQKIIRGCGNDLNRPQTT